MSASAASMQGRLLVVDDNEMNRDLLARRLRKRGYEVDVAEDGQRALQLVEARGYHGVLLDIMMPDMSGIEVLQKLRERHTKTDLPVLMATAKTASEDMVEAFRLGANDYVTKPLDFQVVIARLEAHLDLQRQVASQRPTAAPVLFTGSALQPGAILGENYKIQGILGEGGFAVVYRALQLSTQRSVALKMLRPERLNADREDEELARFELEMRVIGRVNHPSIVALVDSGTVEVERQMGAHGAPDRPAVVATLPAYSAPDESTRIRVPFTVMELLTGRTLEQYLEKGPLHVEQAIDLLLPVLDGVFELNRQGIIHRDLKPSNIFLSEGQDGVVTPKVLDFGLAKPQHSQASGLTDGSSVLGTPQYMAPEQIRGTQIDARIDQHALGVSLYQMLAGVTPYEGESDLHVLSAVCEGRSIPLRTRAPHVGPELAEIVAKAMSSQPDERFADLRELANAVVPFASEGARVSWLALRARGALGADRAELPGAVAESLAEDNRTRRSPRLVDPEAD